ncbi:cell division protein ZapE [Methylobacter luteus]|uniref:cell division protein ZapE n=1 Tax=Methylobacter luteus TaxID=415 RepID=UPI001E32457E|nr:cell division protein ZapE [Methylobacter luteus]
MEKHYRELVVKRHIQNDDAQVEVLGHLQQLLDTISEKADYDSKLTLGKLLSAKPEQGRSLYIFGDVGRGKSMLMDFFFQACPIKHKRRIHFHVFMQEIHHFIHQWRQSNSGDPIPALARHIRKSTLLLCFDEFNVSDIADAMILARLFQQLFEKGVIMVATSNYHPDALYKDGLQRELFLPFIALLKQSAEILELVAKADYRLTHLKALSTTFHASLGEAGDEFLRQSYKNLTNGVATESVVLQVQGRHVHFEAAHDDILFTSFKELCSRALGAADYLTIAREFNTLLLADIPKFSLENKDEAQRFVVLIDVLYEHNVKLICTAAAPADQLYTDEEPFEFKRTQSRLVEMQSERYLSKGQVSA